MNLLPNLIFLVMLSSLQLTAAPDSKLVRPLAHTCKFFADFSFRLDELFVPLILRLKQVAARRLGLHQLSPGEPLHFAIYLGMLAMLSMLSGGSYLSCLLFK